MAFAANGDSEPNLYLEYSRCVRTQREKCRTCKKSAVATLRENRSFGSKASKLERLVSDRKTNQALTTGEAVQMFEIG